MSPKQWAEKTGAIGITSKSGKHGGTFAHKDLAFEFGAWISPMFKLYLIKEVLPNARKIYELILFSHVPPQSLRLRKVIFLR